MTNNGKNAKGSVVEEIMKVIKEKGFGLEDIKKALEELSNPDTGSQSCNYTELKQDSYSLKEVIAWVKKHFNPNLHNAASLLKEEGKSGEIILSCCLMDKKDEPMSDSKDPFLRVITKELDEDLKKNFGNKNMIVLR
ncbi:hypothetical protein [Helicobacter bizzozeronii]|uniref:hypothetical protein n=1 Tax=Helicobacter bizzozeronii TaxID=56877 RepID=UPI000CEEBBBA|nr:hypothetical protein [Helicobacter bizzozeronii]